MVDTSWCHVLHHIFYSVGNILNCEILPDCGLIVSSRPHASVNLHEEASVQVEILCFTEEEREHYIHHALKQEPHSIINLTNYLEQHWTISSFMLFKPGTRWLPKIVSVRTSVCVFVCVCVCVCLCVCLPLKLLITIGMMWCGMDPPCISNYL